jgi:hypothetical protein
MNQFLSPGCTGEGMVILLIEVVFKYEFPVGDALCLITRENCLLRLLADVEDEFNDFNEYAGKYGADLTGSFIVPDFLSSEFIRYWNDKIEKLCCKTQIFND